MERYSFFDAQQIDGGYDRVYSSADMARYFSSFVGNGVYAQPSTSLRVSAHNGLQIRVAPGKGWINGYYYELTQEPKILTVLRGDSTWARIDRVVLRLNLTDRLIELKVIAGTPAAVPNAPDLVRDEATYDLGLATITVLSGSTVISNSQITDTRPNNSVCGWVHQVVDKIDTTDLFQQYDNEFDTWFQSVKGTMSGDVATNLTEKVTESTNAVNEMKSTVDSLKDSKAFSTTKPSNTTLPDDDGVHYATGHVGGYFAPYGSGETATGLFACADGDEPYVKRSQNPTEYGQVDAAAIYAGIDGTSKYQQMIDSGNVTFTETTATSSVDFMPPVKVGMWVRALRSNLAIISGAANQKVWEGQVTAVNGRTITVDQWRDRTYGSRTSPTKVPDANSYLAINVQRYKAAYSAHVKAGPEVNTVGSNFPAGLDVNISSSDSSYGSGRGIAVNSTGSGRAYAAMTVAGDYGTNLFDLRQANPSTNYFAWKTGKDGNGVNGGITKEGTFKGFRLPFQTIASNASIGGESKLIFVTTPGITLTWITGDAIGAAQYNVGSIFIIRNGSTGNITIGGDNLKSGTGAIYASNGTSYVPMMSWY